VVITDNKLRRLFVTRRTVFKYWLTIVLVLVAIILVHNKFFPYNLNATLDYYGYDGGDQKRALKDLFQKSSMDINERTFSQSAKEQQLLENILKMVQEVQNKLIVRKGTQERWDVKSADWMEQDKDSTLQDLKKLGVVNAISPRSQKVDAVCILGATKVRMEDRIRYLESLMQSGLQFKSLILLTGERYVTKDIDAAEQELAAIAEKFQVENWQALTEKHLMQDLYDRSNLASFPAHVIDTPRGDLPRATTYTTVMDLIGWLKEHPEIKNIIFISNQPYVKYQYAIIDAIFREQKSAVSFEVVGSAANTDNLQPIIEALGSYIWAYTPTVLLEMHLKIDDPEIKRLFKELYKKHPLIYSQDFAVFK
jgi:3-dehydroquinate dehydratase